MFFCCFIDGPYPDELRYTNIEIVEDWLCYLDFGNDLYLGMMCAGTWGPSERDTCSVSEILSILTSL